MKRLSLILGLIAFFAMAYATDPDPDVYMRSNQTYGDYTGDDGDTCIYGTTWNCLFYVGLAEKSRYTLAFYVEGDTVTGCSGNVTIQAQGSYEGVTDFDNIGSSVTWTTTADYNANTVLNTYTTLASGTQTIATYDLHGGGTLSSAAYDIPHIGTATVDSFSTGLAIDSLITYTDTLEVPAITVTRDDTVTVEAQTITDARTVTVTLPGVDYRYVRILFTGASGANVEIDKVAIKVTPVTVPGL